jgi:hypothetical protein
VAADPSVHENGISEELRGEKCKLHEVAKDG